jgi:hypothetical protein
VRARYDEMNDAQPGDLVNVADEIVTLSRRDEPPLRFVLDAAAYDVATDAHSTRRAELQADEATARATEIEPT